MAKMVVLHSGGLDSTVLLTKCVKLNWECYPLSILYGQRHSKEIEAARVVSLTWDLPWKCLDLTNLRELISSALHGKGDIPRGHYSDEIQKVTVSPNRNMILLAIAAGYAETIGAERVAYAAHVNDRAIYPDCRPEFIVSAGETIRLGTDGKVTLYEPFMNYTKADIVREGLDMGAPLFATWSCYNGNSRPCLECGTCLERTEAFKIAGVADPALRADEWKTALEKLQLYSK